MAVKVFNRQGLRRDRNLSDLPSPLSALNNILSTPTMLGNNPSFTVQDLLPITQIYITNINSSTFASLDGVTVSFTVVENGVVNNATNPRTYLPLIKVKNRLDTAYFSTGEPFFYGGDGPDAAYYDSDKIVRDPEQLTLNKIYLGNQIIVSNNKLYRTTLEAQTATTLTHTSGEVNGFTYVANYDPETVFLNGEFDQLTGQETTVNDNFWEQGQFIYGNKVQDTFVSLFGGANWKGFFKPTESGISRFYVRTTGSTVFKFQDPGSPSYVGVRYGKVNASALTSAGGNLQVGSENYVLWQSIVTKNNDPTISIVEVVLESPVVLSHNDIVYLEILEGPALPKQYNILTYNHEPASISKFWIEVTEDFNLQNVQLSTLPTPALNPIAGYRGYARYFPYDTRQLKTYINSIYHKLFINQYTVSGANSITINDDFEYQHIMINDYIYDYRRRSTDSTNGVRRYIVTGLNDTTRTVTLQIDANYSIDEGNYNDQVAYNSNGSLSFTSGTEITQVYNTGNINEAIAAATLTNDLYFVGRYGESTLRTKFIAISQFLEAYVDYAFDWLYYTKDEDIDPTTTNKAWILWYASETSGGYFPVNYKYLYSRNYKFYEIGDFKIFLDNSIPGGGTSRETGIDQRAFGAKQLVSKGDQYNELYTLLPIRSTYTPKENWNQVALSRTASLSNGSRLIGLSNITDVQVGNYIVENSDTGFATGNFIANRTRVNSISINSNSVIVSKPATASGSTSCYVFDHRGFVSCGVLESVAANLYNFYGDGSELQIGMCIVALSDPNKSSYVRIQKIVQFQQLTRITLDQDIFGISSAVEGPFASTSNNSFPNSQYGWHTRSAYDETNPYSNVRQLVIRWNSVTIYDSATSTTPIPTSGGITVGQYTYYPDAYYASIYGWSNDENNAFGVRRESTGGTTRCAVYYDRGVDITKPLEAFCTETGCSQNDYDAETDTVRTRYIAVNVGNDTNSTLDLRWTESSLTGSYYTAISSITENYPARNTYTNGSASLSWWSDAYPNQTGPNMSTRVGGVGTQTAINTGYTTSTGNVIQQRKRYGSSVVYAQLSGTELGTAIRKDYPNFPIGSYFPIGIIEGFIRLRGDLNSGIYTASKTIVSASSTGALVPGATREYTLNNVSGLLLLSMYLIIPNNTTNKTLRIIDINYNTNTITVINAGSTDITFTGTTANFQMIDRYYCVLRILDRIQSIPHNNLGNWKDGVTLSDGTTKKGVTIDLTKYPSTAFNFTNLGFGADLDMTLPYKGTISTLTQLQNIYTSYVNDAPNYTNTGDRMYQVTADITVSNQNALTWFYNPSSFVRDDGAGNISYVIPAGSWFKTYSSTGTLLWFNDFEDIQDTESLFSYRPLPNTLPTNQTSGDIVSINILPKDGPLKITNDDLTTQYQFLHYRRKQYEVLGMPAFIEKRYPGIRVINPNLVYAGVENAIENSVNQLSVFTFANTIDNKELCCPPLDTSPPFDSSQIGLATTTNEPNMSIGGLVNVRSIAANHPQEKIHNIPSGFSNSTLSVDKKLEIVFGGLKYDLLIADSKPF